MKKVLAGVGLMLTGAIVMLAAYVATGAATVNSIFGWDADIGIFWSYMGKVKLTATMVFGILFIVAGIGIAAWGIFDKSDK